MAASLAMKAAAMPTADRVEWLAGLSPGEADGLMRDWRFWARPEQLGPDGQWLCWLILAGRGFGKTRAGAEWVLDRLVAGDRRGALVARTSADCRDVMVEGESGLIACAERRGLAAVYEPSKRRVTFPVLGASLTMFSAEEPDQLRGPQHELAWGDEVAAWPAKTDAMGNGAWSNLLMGLRLGTDPRVVATTTPRNVPLIRELVKAPTTVVTRGSTYDNLSNLAPSFKETVLAKYEGTRLGRQELMAELLEDVDGALWTLASLDAGRVSERPELKRIVVAIDPPASSTGAECGIVVVGKGYDDNAYVLADRSRQGTPDVWARAALQAYLDTGADEIVIEVNQGGDMAAHTVTVAAAAMAAEGAPLRTVKVKRVHASRGKRTRAEPVSALYEQGRVHHVGTLPELEDQMTSWTPDAGASPDRLDAVVWAVTRLMLESSGATFREW
jgi:phage terminase large subunit-like protein